MAKNNDKTVGKVNKVTFGKVLIYIVLIIWAFTTIFPFVWVVNNSFKAPNKIMRYALSLAGATLLITALLQMRN